MPHVALLLVSHSEAVAAGTAQIAGQMAPDVQILAAGGTDDGIGTSVDRVLAALERLGAGLLTTGWEPLREGAGVVVLTDLGSAVLTTEAVLEMVDEKLAALVRTPDAPFVEGAVLAAVEAQQGAGLEEVAAAAVRAGLQFGAGTDTTAPGPARPATGSVPQTTSAARAGQDGADQATAAVTVVNPLGLHARPAAVVARAVADLDVPVSIDGVDGRSVLELLQLGAVGGRTLTVSASGPGAQEAVDTVVRLIAAGFGEVEPAENVEPSATA